jgi:uncharacterized membrane protein YfcA
VTAADWFLLFTAGIAAGIIGSTAGLASLVSYPALLLVGLPPVTANVTNTVGLIGSSIGSVAGSRRELTGLGPLIMRRLPVAVVGGGIGAALLLLSPPGSFAVVVPYLVAAASVLLLLSPLVRRISASRQRSGAVQTDGGPAVIAGIFGCCVYGGYFGAAAGVMLLALLLAGTDRTLPVANAIKNLLLGAANATAAVAFTLTGEVAWAAVPPLLLGCMIGGRIGPGVVRVVPPTVMRWVIGIAGLGLSVRLWLG